MEKQQKKILVVCQHFWPEAFRINDLCDYFIEHKCQIDVLCGLPNYPRGEFYDDYGYFGPRKEKHNGVNIYRSLEIKRGSNSNIRIFLNYISFPITSIFHIPRFVFKKYDKVLIYQLSPVMMSISGIIIAKIKKIESIMYVLDLWPENLYSVLNINNKFLNKIITSISHWHYRHVDKLVVLSEKMKARLVDITKIDESKIIVLPQACEKIYEQDASDSTLNKRFKNGFNILYTGNISPAQSFSTIIEAAQILKSRGVNDLNWIIVGDGMSKEWVEDEVSKAGLNSEFYFEGMQPIENIPKYTPIADVLVGCLVKSPLLEATIPAKVMSYIAAGKPIVLSMDGEVKDLIENKIGCGFVGETEESMQLADNIEKIYRLTKKDRNKLGVLAKKYHFMHFERNISLDKLYHFMFG